MGFREGQRAVLFLEGGPARGVVVGPEGRVLWESDGLNTGWVVEERDGEAKLTWDANSLVEPPIDIKGMTIDPGHPPDLVGPEDIEAIRDPIAVLGVPAMSVTRYPIFGRKEPDPGG